MCVALCVVYSSGFTVVLYGSVGVCMHLMSDQSVQPGGEEESIQIGLLLSPLSVPISYDDVLDALDTSSSVDRSLVDNPYQESRVIAQHDMLPGVGECVVALVLISHRWNTK